MVRENEIRLLSNKERGTLYVGSTSDLVGRIWQHKNKIIPGFTSRYGIDRLVYYEWHPSLRDMVIRERRIKDWKRDWKIRLIMEMNPTWDDLYPVVLVGAGYSPDM